MSKFSLPRNASYDRVRESLREARCFGGELSTGYSQIRRRSWDDRQRGDININSLITGLVMYIYKIKGLAMYMIINITYMFKK
jgi:hypothetical protein